MEKVVIYARYSSDKQTEQSIEGQISVCQDFIKRNNYQLIGTYIDRAMTGTNDNRPDFLKMIKDSEKKNFRYVIVYKLDRFSRNRYDNAKYKSILKKNGVKVLSACEQITDSPEGIILESLLEGMAEYYSAELSQKIKRGQVESLKKKNTLGGLVPFGYRTINKKYFIDEEESIIVKDIFNSYNAGKTIKQITTDLKCRGIKNSHNRFFCHNSIMNMLKNQKYIGVYKFGNTSIQDYFPAIISKEVFDMTQNNLKTRKRKSGEGKAKINYLLSGKLYCGLCGAIMTGETGTSKTNKIYHYYKCSSKKRFQSCNKENVKKEWIERIVLNSSIEHIFKNNFYKIMVNNIVKIYNEELASDDVLKNLKSNKTKTENEIRNILNCIKSGTASKSLTDELSKLELELSDIEAQIVIQENVHIRQIGPEHIEFLFEQFRNLDLNNEELCERFIDTFIHKVVLYEDKVLIVYNHSGKNDEKIKISDIESICDDSECSDIIQDSVNSNAESLKISKITLGSDLCRMVEVERIELSSRK